MKKSLLAMLLCSVVYSHHAMAQNNKPPVSYPLIKGYVSLIHPIVTFDKNATTFNFKNDYTVIVPIGLNLYKNSKVGFSFEVAPVIKADSVTSKVTNLVFHPGIILPLKNRFAFLTRLAFETAGRYGFTPVISKTLTKNAQLNYFATIATPVRFGNLKPASIGIAFQIGMVF